MNAPYLLGANLLIWLTVVYMGIEFLFMLLQFVLELPIFLTNFKNLLAGANKKIKLLRGQKPNYYVVDNLDISKEFAKNDLWMKQWSFKNLIIIIKKFDIRIIWTMKFFVLI